MIYIYIDESGDLGMTCKETNYFVISAVKIDDERTDIEYSRIPKRIRQRTLKKKLKETSELKFSNSTPLIREQFLKRAARLNIHVYALSIKKRFTQDKLKGNLPILYNYLTKTVLEKMMPLRLNEKVRICLDECMSSSQRENFEIYLKTYLFNPQSGVPDVKISHEDSQRNPKLQVTDFICGAFGYKYNKCSLEGDATRYVDIIKNRITFEKSDFFKE